jgi:hypothetical protein
MSKHGQTPVNDYQEVVQNKMFRLTKPLKKDESAKVDTQNAGTEVQTTRQNEEGGYKLD